MDTDTSPISHFLNLLMAQRSTHLHYLILIHRFPSIKIKQMRLVGMLLDMLSVCMLVRMRISFRNKNHKNEVQLRSNLLNQSSHLISFPVGFLVYCNILGYVRGLKYVPLSEKVIKQWGENGMEWKDESSSLFQIQTNNRTVDPDQTRPNSINISTF